MPLSRPNKSKRSRHSRRSRSSRHTRRTRRTIRSRKSKPSSWSNTKPSSHERTVMKAKCGSKCFLGPKKSFPICKRNTCTISPKGVEAAYKRARQWHHQSIANKARRLQKKYK